MAKARAELKTLRQGQVEAAQLQESAEAEAIAMRARISDLEQQVVSADVRAKEQDLTIVRLRSELAIAASAPSVDELTALNSKIALLERQLAAEHERRVRLMQVLKTHDVAVAPSAAKTAVATPVAHPT